MQTTDVGYHLPVEFIVLADGREYAASAAAQEQIFERALKRNQDAQIPDDYGARLRRGWGRSTGEWMKEMESFIPKVKETLRLSDQQVAQLIEEGQADNPKELDQFIKEGKSSKIEDFIIDIARRSARNN